MESNSNESQIKKGILEIPILIAVVKERYVSEILKLLEKYNLFVPEGTIYPILTRLLKLNYVKYSWVESQSGPPRKYFQITPAGQDYLKESLIILENLTTTINNLKTTI